MSKKLSIILIAIVIFSLPSQLAATVAPNLSSLVRRSDIILVGTVLEAKETTSSEGYIVKIKTKQILKGSATFSQVTSPKTTLQITYKRIGKGNIKFQKLAENKMDQIFYLKGEPENSREGLQLIDAWFGVEKATKKLVDDIKSIRPKSELLFAVEESGGCFRTRTCRVFLLFNDGHYTLSKNKGQGQNSLTRLLQGRIQKKSDLELDAIKPFKNLAKTIDTKKLKSKLEKGYCAGCVDGIDLRFFILENTKLVVLSSLDYNLNDSREPVLRELSSLYKSMSSNLKLEPIFLQHQ